jgi:FG-GAP repeat
MSSQYRLRRRKHMKHVLPRIVFWMLFCLVTRVAAQQFSPAKNYSFGTKPVAVVVGDFNRDGTFRNATFNPCVSSGDCTPLSSAPNWLSTGDFNGDGSPDVVVSNPNANGVSVFLNLSPTTKDFTVSATALEPSSLNPGQSSTATIDISATSTFNGTVTLHCSISPEPANAPQCSVAPASIEPGALANLTIRTTAPSAARARRENRGFTGSSGLCSVAFGLLFVGLTQKRKREAWSRSVSMLAGCSLMVFILIFEIACGGSNSPLGGNTGGGDSGTPSGSYTISVVARSDSIEHSTSQTITVR